MPKMPDFSKFDLQSIVSSVKSVISPEPLTEKVKEGDPLGTKLAEISELVKKVSDMQNQSAKDLNQVNNLLSGLYGDIEAIRQIQQDLASKFQAEKELKIKMEQELQQKSETQFKTAPEHPESTKTTAETHHKE